ncbi:sensor histidine kinase [Ornithinimicrobium pekingense]|uniref:Histidine kinase/HSP90-like ATPase domain-containing protein n=1 Tax=Ornithinimicrobium pekingense TaxID=384677 RepID=A0ABQ2FCB5_9MICO|nr:ATP-binding protein [Ornithinimicrobium pekingense]GGK80500.1 hypothetical protein GCM10011509_31250 [Ornithinimicrobium pekingense]
MLSDTSYLKVCRSLFAFRLLACSLTAALSPSASTLAAALLLLSAVISAWAMLDNRFVRGYFRHPLLVGLDLLVIVLYLSVDWPADLGLLVLAVSAIVIGLTLTPWLSLPGLIMLLGSVIVLGSGSTEPWPVSSTLGLACALVGSTALGWTIRHAFVELQLSRDLILAERVRLSEEAERARLARAMHDSLGKTVNGISLAASALQSAATRRPEQVATIARDLEAASRVAADESRTLLRALRRHQVDRPLAEQLGELARSYATPGRQVRTTVAGIADLPPDQAEEVVCIVAEALENVERHASATTVDVRLRHEDGVLVLTVTDDGKGFDLRSVPARERQGHFGLRGMRERAERTGGRVRIDSARGRGTTVEARWQMAQTEVSP